MHLNVAELCDGNLEAKCLILEVTMATKILFSLLVSVVDLLEQDEHSVSLEKISAMSLQILYREVFVQNTFLDYFTNGWEILPVVAIGNSKKLK
jgi:hypothetical protein